MTRTNLTTIKPANYATVMMIGSLAVSCGAARSTMPRPQVRWYVVGIPESRPALIVQGSDERMPAIAWNWKNHTGLHAHQSVRGSLPWSQVVLTPRRSIMFYWNPVVSPNFVNFCLLRARPKAGSPVTPGMVLASCTVNVTYPSGHGCKLDSSGLLTVDPHTSVWPNVYNNLAPSDEHMSVARRSHHDSCTQDCARSQQCAGDVLSQGGQDSTIYLPGLVLLLPFCKSPVVG